MKKLILGAVIALSIPAMAQVHRCTDAKGKITYSDAPCATSSVQASEVLSRQQVESTRANEQAMRQAQQERALQESFAPPLQRADLPRQPVPRTQDPAPGGAVIFDHDPNQRIREQEERNMARRMAELEASKRRREERDLEARDIPLVINRCDRFGCHTNKGYAPR